MLAAAWWSLRFPAVQRADVALGERVRGAAPRPAVDRSIVATTDLGSLYAITAIGTVLAATGRPRLAADVAGVGGLAWAVSQTAKTGVRRARPYETEGNRRLVRPPTGSSFPSGHATVAAAWTTLVAERATTRCGRVLLSGIGAYVAASRVYVGVHYPTDVLGGVGIGLMLSAAWRGPLGGAARALVGGPLRAATTWACRITRT